MADISALLCVPIGSVSTFLGHTMAAGDKVFNTDVPAGGASPAWTETFEDLDATWRANWTRFVYTDEGGWHVDTSANFTRSNTWKSQGTYGCAIQPGGTSIRYAMKNYGSTPSKIRFHFKNDTANGMVFISFGNFERTESSTVDGMACYYKSDGNLFALNEWGDGGTLGADVDSESISLSDETEYIMEINISVAGGTTTITGKLFNTSEVQQGADITYGYSNTSWTTDVCFGFGVTDVGEIQYIDQFEVYT